MRKKALLLACAGLLCAIVIAFVAPDFGDIPGVAISIRQIGTNLDRVPQLVVIVSNALEGSIVYNPTVEVVSLRNGHWETNFIGGGGIGSIMTQLSSGQSEKPFVINRDVSIGQDTYTIRAGFEFTSLSWRGALAFRLSTWHFLAPVSSRLFQLDKTSRSRFQWSNDFHLSNTNRLGMKDGDLMPRNLMELLSLPHDQLETLDCARVNLLCAQDLQGAQNIKINATLETCDQMAVRVRWETDRHAYRFHDHPEEFENSEGFFRMIMLAVVLAEDFGIHYASNKIGTAANARLGDGFFNDSENVFLHGLTGPNRHGTCSSLPVLYVAIGRRLSYPLKLVTTKGHLFVRWEDSHERFNIEATGRGVSRFSDDYYRDWPMKVSDEEVKSEGYLQSLTPAEELAVFLSIRGMCWCEAKRYSDAAISFREASRLSPNCREYGLMATKFEAVKSEIESN